MLFLPLSVRDCFLSFTSTFHFPSLHSPHPSIGATIRRLSAFAPRDAPEAVAADVIIAVVVLSARDQGCSRADGRGGREGGEGEEECEGERSHIFLVPEGDRCVGEVGQQSSVVPVGSGWAELGGLSEGLWLGIWNVRRWMRDVVCG